MIFVKSLVLLATVFQVSSGKLTRIYDNSTFLDHANTSAVKFSWKYEPSQDVLFMALEVKATGWIGFGFAKRIFQMQGYDVIIGKVENGRGRLTDRHTVGYMEPLADYQQDYNMTYFEEVNGTTTLEFHRKRVTGDSKDLDIKLGPMLLVYAYHSTDDYPSPYKTKHDHQGYKTVVLLPWDTKIPQNLTSSINPQAISTTTGLRSPIHTTIRSSSSVAMSTSKHPILKPLTTTVDLVSSSVASSTPLGKYTVRIVQASLISEHRNSTRILQSSTPLPSTVVANLRPTASEQRTTSLVMLPTIMPSSSMVSTAIVMSSSVMSSLSPSYSSVHVPIFVVPDNVYEKYVKVGLRTKITNVRYELIKDKTKPDFIKFKNKLEKNLESRKHIWKAVVTDIRKGSVIVDYDVYMNTSSLQETRQVIDGIKRDVKKGRLGGFVVDPGYSFDPVITMKVPLEQGPSSSTIRTAEPTNNLIFIILLGCAFGLVFIMLIVIIVLAIRIRKKSHSSSSYSLKPIGRVYEYDVNY